MPDSRVAPLTSERALALPEDEMADDGLPRVQLRLSKTQLEAIWLCVAREAFARSDCDLPAAGLHFLSGMLGDVFAEGADGDECLHDFTA